MHIDISHLAIYIEQVSVKEWVEILSAILTPIVAIFACVISYQQWKTAEAQRRQMLFEMRYDNLYKEIFDIHTKMMQLDFTSPNINADLTSLRFEFIENYNKYKFLLSEKDETIIKNATDSWVNIINTYNNMMINNQDTDVNEYKKDQENCLNIITDTLKKYLRIEQDDKNIWEIASNIVKNLFFFTIPKTMIIFAQKHILRAKDFIIHLKNKLEK